MHVQAPASRSGSTQHCHCKWQTTALQVAIVFGRLAIAGHYGKLPRYGVKACGAVAASAIAIVILDSLLAKFGRRDGYTFGERIFRTAVLQEAVASGGLEGALIAGYRKISGYQGGFNVDRALRARDAMRQIGALFIAVNVQGTQDALDVMMLNPGNFEKKVREVGAAWVKKGDCFIIVPPANETLAWNAFKQAIAKFKWRETERGEIVTCDDASLIPDKDNLFLHPSMLPLEMTVRTVGFYLGCKQHVYVFNPSGVGRSTGVASEGRHYEDMITVYNTVKGLFPPENIWITASCGEGPLAAYLKKVMHENGVNLVLESSFSDLRRNFVLPEGWIVSQYAHSYWSGLSSKLERQKRLETGYSIARLVQGLKPSPKGKILVISVTNDQRLRADVAEELVAIARSVNREVFDLRFRGEGANPHSARYFLDASARRKALSFIFSVQE